MMRGQRSVATAVRDSEGKIQVESKRFIPLRERSVFFRIPVVRGIISFANSLVSGTKTLMRASEVYGDVSNEEPSKFEKWLAKTFKLDIMDVVTWVGVILGVLLSVFLFIFVPNFITDGFYRIVSIDGLESTIGKTIIKNLTSGAIRILIFVLYIFLTSLLKDIKRLYMYHGAEHKVISCYESGLEMNVENAQKMSTVHDRCGTTFMFIVMIFSIFFFSFFGWQQLWLRVLIRILCVPLVAGLSYEILKFLAKYDNVFVRILKAPGLLLQKLTTKQPEDAMVEVAIKAFNTVLIMDSDESVPETVFVTSVTLEKAKEELISVFGDRKYSSEAELLLMHVTGADKKSGLLLNKKRVLSTELDCAKAMAEERLKGKPLQYITGSAPFYGLDIKVDSRVLIPRFDTEHLAEAVIKECAKRENPAVLELCTGSGAVSIAVKLNSAASVTATDVSQDALDVAEENAKLHNAEITFIKSDLFTSVDGKFDVIAANPPYIPSADISTLHNEVKDFEPLTALDGGADGLNFYRAIAAEYTDYLNDGGVLMLEIGAGQADAVKQLFDKEIETVMDYNNPPVERVLIIKN